MGGIRVRSRSGAQVPLGSLAAVEKTLGPRGVDRYNLYPAAAVTVGLRPGVSTGLRDGLSGGAGEDPAQGVRL